MLKNTTKNTNLTSHIKHCHSFFSKFKGLMFTRPIKGLSLIFHFKKEKRIDLHMFFVLYPIDVLWLNKKKEVVQIKQNFKPFRLIMAKAPAQYIIELPKGTIEKTNTELGDKIDF